MFGFKKNRSNAPVGRMRPTQTPPARTSTVFSYHASRSARAGQVGRNGPTEAEKILKRKGRLTWLRRTPNIAGVVLVILLLGLALRLGNKVQVIPLGDTSAQVFLRTSEEYQRAAEAAFAESFLNGNKLTVDTGAIVRDLRQQFPELRVVSVALPVFGDQPTVYIQPSAPKLLLKTRDSGMFVLDGGGRALIAGTQVPRLDRLKLPVVTDDSGLQITVGKAALPSDTVHFITEVAGQLQAKQLTISSIVLPANGTELHIRVNGEPYYIRFNLRGNARVEAGAFLAVKDHLQKQGKKPAEYIDVRVESRAYYK